MAKNRTLVYQYIAIGAVVIGGVALATAFAQRLKRKKHEADTAEAQQSVAQSTDTVQEIVESFSGMSDDPSRVGIWHPAMGEGSSNPNRVDIWHPAIGAIPRKGVDCRQCEGSTQQCPDGQTCKDYLAPDGTTCSKCEPIGLRFAGGHTTEKPSRVVTALDTRGY